MTRAYLFANGQLLLANTPHESSGGPIDVGLQSFFDAYWVLPFHSERAITRKELSDALELTWKHQNVFRSAPGTASYFPLIYLPQATAIKLGKWFGIGVETTYYFARLAALVTAIALITLAFRTEPPSPAVFAVMCFPMMLFQFAATSIDGITTGISVAVASAYIAMHKHQHDVSRSLLGLLAFGIWVVVSCRPYLLPMTLLIAATPTHKHRRFAIALTTIAVLSLIAWFGFTMASTVDGRREGAANAGNNVRLFCLHPWLFVDCFASTLTNFGWIRKTVGSFFGYLGWLDTPLPVWGYVALLAGFTAVVLLSFAGKRNLVSSLRFRTPLFIAGAGSAVLIFIIAAIAFDVSKTRVLNGIQGRYFTIPVLLLLYAVTDGTHTFLTKRGKAAVICLAGICLASMAAMIPALVLRYYVH